MTKRSAGRLQSVPFFVMRVPLLPFTELQEWSESAASPLVEGALNGDLGGAAKSLDVERRKLQGGLVALVDRPEVREALYLASPDFEKIVDGWVADPDMEGHERIERTLCKYFARMAGRPTPFGLFAAVASGKAGEETNLFVAPRSAIRRRSRLDLGYLDQLIESLIREPRWRRELPLRANPTAYRGGASVRYVEAPFDETGKRRHHLVALERSSALDEVLKAASGAATPDQLEALLAAKKVKPEGARRFVEQLVDAQALVPALGAAVTGSDPSARLASELAAWGAASPAAQGLEKANEILAGLDDDGIGLGSDRYRAVAEALAEMPIRPDRANLVQVDIARPSVDSCLGSEVKAEILRGVEVLERLTPHKGESDLELFGRAFEERYQGRRVPLLEALDSELGIGYPAAARGTAGSSPLIRGLTLGRVVEKREPWGSRERMLLRKLESAASSGDEEIVLEERDLAELGEDEVFRHRRGSVAAMARLAARSPEDLDQGRFSVYLSGIDGPGGARLLARFATIDPQLEEGLAKLIESEEALEPDGVVAEIVHVPEGRAGNVLHRPLLRRFEIPVLGRSGAPSERQIPLSDLWLSVEGDRVILRSQRLDCRVIPRQTTAYDASRDGVVANRFLCALSVQEHVDGNRWDWGPLATAPFLPRVRSGRTILSLARWNLDGRPLAELRRLHGVHRVLGIRRWRQEHPVQVPRWVALAEGDEHLPLDLENPLMVETFLHATKRMRELALVELFPAGDELVSRGPEGAFVSELVVPLLLEPERSEGVSERGESDGTREPMTPVGERAAPVPRRFPPGSEWLFAKLYCGPVTADNLLREVIGPLVRRVMKDERARSWHFLRYGDPEWHLRIRFGGEPSVLREEVFPALNDALSVPLEDGRIWKVQIDTYEREVERYGGPGAIEVAEEIFRLDSELALWMVERLEKGARGEEERWKLALCGVDRLLCDFEMDLRARQGLVGAVKEGLASELGMGRELRRELAERYRRYADELMVLLSPPVDPGSPLRLGLDAMERRSRGMEPLVGELRELAKTGVLETPLPDLAASFVHLQVNRILRSAPRATELVVYDFLDRLYRSRAALARRDQIS